MIADLHTHTTASDGVLTPRQLIGLAWNIGLKVIAITDHDTVSGLPEGLAAGKECGLEVIPGVELSTEWEDREIHILGYFIDWHHEILRSFLAQMRQDRWKRLSKMVARLRYLGYDISEEEVKEEARGEAVGRPHVADVLVKKGYFPDRKTAFLELLERGRKGYVPRRKVEPGEAVEVILKCGGVPVLAHPGFSRADGLIPHLVNLGLWGIEVYHPSHDQEAVERYLQMARRHNLLITGGSDFHSPQGEYQLGQCRVGPEEVEELRWAHRQIIKRKALTYNLTKDLY